MKDLNFPLKFKFHISTLSNDFTATDANGQVVAFVRQKMFKLKEAVNVYSDQQKSRLLFTISADRWLDFNAAYSFREVGGIELGKIVRKGWRSIWKVHYELIDQHQQLQYHIREENAWVKVIDGLIGEIPFLNFLTGYLFNPAYLVLDNEGETVIRLEKTPSFFGRKFEVIKLKDIDRDDSERIMLGLMMMVLLERRRG